LEGSFGSRDLKRMKRREGRAIVSNLRFTFRGNFKVVGRWVLWKFLHENMLLFFNGVMIEA